MGKSTSSPPYAGQGPRVALYIHRLPLANPTGVHRYATEIAQALSNSTNSYQIELCSGRVTDDISHLGLTVPLTHPRAPRRTLHLAWTVARRPAIERVVGRLDLLHPVLPAFPIRSRAPQVLTIHDLLPLHHPEWYGWFPLRAFRRTIDFNVPRARTIIVPSTVVARDVERTLRVDPKRIAVIHEGVGAEFGRTVDEAAAARTAEELGVGTRPFLVTVGAISPRKNLSVVFDALARLERQDGEAPALVVVGGDGNDATRTRAAAEASGAAHLIIFAGRLADEQLHHLLSRAAGLVHPSRYEGFGLTPLEAMAAGTPVIAANASAIPEVVGKSGLLVDPDDAAAWTAAIRSVVGDAAVSERLQAAGRRRAGELTWDRAAQLTLKVYDAILGGSTTPQSQLAP